MQKVQLEANMLQIYGEKNNSEGYGVGPPARPALTTALVRT